MTETTVKPSLDTAPEKIAIDRRRQECLGNIRRHGRRSRRGLWGLVLFTAISVGVLNLSFLPMATEEMRRFLGAPPPVSLISLALVVYSFAALILILSRMMSGSESYRGWSHLAYLSAFYGFYFAADALKENFWAVFAAGLTILALEYYHLWTCCSEAIQREKELLARLERQQETP
jgi:hypothetical protein